MQEYLGQYKMMKKERCNLSQVGMIDKGGILGSFLYKRVTVYGVGEWQVYKVDDDIFFMNQISFVGDYKLFVTNGTHHLF